MTADDDVLRLRAEVAQARLDALNAQLAAAEARTGGSTPPPEPGTYADLPPSSTPSDSRLSSPPRHVPLVYRLLILPFSWYALFSIFMMSVAPIIVWLGFPEVGMVMVVLTLVVIFGLRIRKHLRQLALLKWGEVATVLGSDVQDVGTYYSGMTYNNMRVPIAHGWDVDRGFYNGPGTKEKIHYSINGTEGVLTLRGRGYENGVILANSRKPSVAMCVSSFPYDLKRDAAGDWTGEVGTKVIVTAAIMAILVAGWAVGSLLLLDHIRTLTPLF